MFMFAVMATLPLNYLSCFAMKNIGNIWFLRGVSCFENQIEGQGIPFDMFGM